MGLRVLVYNGQNQPDDTSLGAAAEMKGSSDGRQQLRAQGRRAASGRQRELEEEETKLEEEWREEHQGRGEEEEERQHQGARGRKAMGSGGRKRERKPGFMPTHLVCASDLAQADIVLTTYGEFCMCACLCSVCAMQSMWFVRMQLLCGVEFVPRKHSTHLAFALHCLTEMTQGWDLM